MEQKYTLGGWVELVLEEDDCTSGLHWVAALSCQGCTHTVTHFGCTVCWFGLEGGAKLWKRKKVRGLSLSGG